MKKVALILFVVVLLAAMSLVVVAAAGAGGGGGGPNNVAMSYCEDSVPGSFEIQPHLQRLIDLRWLDHSSDYCNPFPPIG